MAAVVRSPGRYGALVGSQLIAGVGTASGVTVGALLVQQLTGITQIAGLSQAATTLGAGLAAIPIARLAMRRGRQTALTVGYLGAAAGALCIVLGAGAHVVPLVFVGLMAFGISNATALQARFVGAELASRGWTARAMSIVLWATTIGSVAGPNLAGLADRFGRSIGLPPNAGPFVFALTAFAVCAIVCVWVRVPRVGADLDADAPVDGVGGVGGADRSEEMALAGSDGPELLPVGQARPLGDGPAGDGSAPEPHAPSTRTGPAPAPRTRPGATLLRVMQFVRDTPAAGLAMVAVVGSHTVMVLVMVMTPLDMHAHGLSLELVGLVISIHVFGMYGASPVIGWSVDRWGPMRVIVFGEVALLAAVAVGILMPPGNELLLPVALGLLGLGWSAGLIGGSALLSRVAPPDLRVPLQGTTDATMYIVAALAAATAGSLLTLGGFALVCGLAAVLLAPLAVLLVIRSGRRALGRA